MSAPVGTKRVVKASRGDLVVVHTTHHDHYIGQETKTHDEFTVGVVTSITRDGTVKACQPVGYDRPVLLNYLGRSLQCCYVIPKDRVDVPAALETAAAHLWPGQDHPRYYDTLADVEAALRPHKL